MKFKIISLTFILLAGGFAVFSLESFIGSAPKKEFSQKSLTKKNSPHEQTDYQQYPELNKYRKEIEQSENQSQRLKNLLNFAEVLLAKAQATQDRTLIFELIDIFNQVLEIEPKNQAALLELGNISFESKVFSKASEYYLTALEQAPDNDFIRGRYASSLIFLGKTDQAIKELDVVLSRSPEDFSAMAYKAIALAEAGKTEEAIELGEKALKYAPDQNGQERLKRFLISLQETPDDNFPDLVNYLTTNQVTASKYEKYEYGEETLILFFSDFPVEAMPEVAKQKFYGSIKNNLKKSNQKVKEVILMDFASNKILDKFSLT